MHDKVEYPDDIRAIRLHAQALGYPWLQYAPDWVVAYLWGCYSDDVYAAGWITGADNQDNVAKFMDWMEAP